MVIGKMDLISSFVYAILKSSVLFIFFSVCFISHAQLSWLYLEDSCKGKRLQLSDHEIAQRDHFDFYDYALKEEIYEEFSNLYKVKGYSRWLNALIIEGEISPELRSDPRVISVERMSYRKVKDVNSSRSIELLSDSGYYGRAWNQIKMLNGHLLHQEGYRGKGVTMALCDNGYQSLDSIRAFDSIFLNNQILGTYDYVFDNDTVFDEGSHGTNVLSTIAAVLPDTLVGTAPESSFYLFVTEDNRSEKLIEEYNWVLAAEAADSLGVDIISTSLGYTIMYDEEENSHSYADMNGDVTPISKAADIAAKKGMLVVVSAGNSGSSDWHFIGAPADADSVLTVGSVDADGEISSFSSRGPSFDGRVKPNICAQGEQAALIGADGRVRTANGTSFSCPIIAGLSACLWQAHPEKSNMEILRAIEMSSSLSEQPDNDYGYGIPDFWKAHELLSDSIFVNFDDPTAKVWTLNPFAHQMRLFINSEGYQNCQLNIYSIAGKLIESREVELYEGVNDKRIILSDVGIGQVVFIEVLTSSWKKTLKLVKTSG